MSKKFLFRAALATAAIGVLAACGSDSDSPTPPPVTPVPPPAVNTKPSYVGTVTVTSYNGTSDDLLTAGLGWDGLQAAAGPALSNPPTAAELRRLAIHTNYRALVDMTSAGGYGSMYGPNVSLTGTVNSAAGAGKVAGKEYIAYSLDASGRAAATLMVQIPTAFNAANPCIVTATSSGSRGVYGAVSAAGEWGLKRGCAVAYTDKGTGNGGHELMSNTITLIDGTTANAQAAGAASLFTANVAAADLLTFNTNNPNRYAYKHAHSQANPEKDWGKFTLQAVEFALYALNDALAPAVTGGKGVVYRADNTLVIAASVSNGGGASLAAAEQDTTGLIDAVVVGEPQINVRVGSNVAVARGGVVYPASAVGRTLYDYTSLANLLQPCAAYATGAVGSPLLSDLTLPMVSASNRCSALVTAGLITGATFQEQADAALQALVDAGWQPEANLLHASHYALNATTGVAVTYANAYSRASVVDNLCGFSFATTAAATGMPAAPAAPPMPSLFSLGNGVPPTNGINVVYNLAGTGPILHQLADGNFAFDGAQCLRDLWTANNAALMAGIDQIKVAGNLRGKPAIIVQGRADALVPVNFASRAYLGANRAIEGTSSQLSYIEVENGQHFDAFLGLAGYDTRFIPVHVYNNQALNMMWAKLTSNAALPPSQVVRTTPRGGTTSPAPALTSANVPPIQLTPTAGNVILTSTLGGVTTVQVPN